MINVAEKKEKMMKRVFDLQEIVMKLVGPISAVGDSGADAQRLHNLKVMCHLVDELLFEIQREATNANRQEASVKASGKYAADFIAEIKAAS